MSRMSFTMVLRVPCSRPSLSEISDTSWAVEIADSFLVTSCESFLPDMTEVLDFLLVLAWSTLRKLADMTDLLPGRN